MSDLKCSNNNNSSSNNINSGSNNNINNNNNSSNNINNSNIDNNKNNINNSNNSSSSGSSNNNATATAAAVTITDMNHDSAPAKRPLAKYPIPCDSVSTVLIHGFLSQGTEYSFFLPPQAENEFIGKRVSNCYFIVIHPYC